MSTVAEIREAIRRLNESERYLLFAELLATFQEPDEEDPEFLAQLDRALEESKTGRCYTAEEVRAMIPKWISESQSPRKL
jgi:predicted transcriptional regulator